MNICIVGNGPSSLKTRNGEFIDSCDIVVRIGHCVIEGYEEYIGSKLDIYAGRWKKLEVHPDLCSKADKIWLLYPPPPHNWHLSTLGSSSIGREKLALERMKVDTSKIMYVPEQIQEDYKSRYAGSLPKMSDALCGFNIPASGTVVIDMVLHFYPDSKIYVTGFDGYFDNTTYYFDKGRTIGKHFTHSHSAIPQYVQLRKLIASKRIHVL